MMTVAIPAASNVSRSFSRPSAMLGRSSGLVFAQWIICQQIAKPADAQERCYINTLASAPRFNIAGQAHTERSQKALALTPEACAGSATSRRKL